MLPVTENCDRLTKRTRITGFRAIHSTTLMTDHGLARPIALDPSRVAGDQSAMTEIDLCGPWRPAAIGNRNWCEEASPADSSFAAAPNTERPCAPMRVTAHVRVYGRDSDRARQKPFQATRKPDRVHADRRMSPRYRPHPSRLGNVEQRPRTLGRHEQQGACSTRWRPPSLFPVLQRSHRHAEQRRKPRLGESSLLSDRSDIGHVDHATVLAALDLAQPIQDLTTHVSLRLSHLPLPFGSAGVCEQACCPQRSSGTS